MRLSLELEVRGKRKRSNMIGTFEGPQGSLEFIYEEKRVPSGCKFIDGEYRGLP